MPHTQNSGKFSFPVQIGIFLGLTGAGMIIASLLSAAIWIAGTGTSIAALREPSQLANPEHYVTVMVIQAVSMLFMMFLPVLLFALICYGRVGRFTGMYTRVSALQFVLVAAILILAFPLSGAIAHINEWIPLPEKQLARFKEMEENRRAMEAIFINIDTLPRLMFSLFVIAVLPAVFEEFFFRAGLQNIFTRWFANPLPAILLTALIFSAIHFSYFGFLVRFALGVILGYVFYYSGSIWTAVVLHFLFNGVQVVAMYVLRSYPAADSTELEKNFPVWAGIPALLLLLVIFQIYKRESRRVQNKFIYRDVHDDDIQNWIANN